jgi:hypothetical protein
MNFGGIWRTGVFAMNSEVEKALGLKENQKILGYLYVGTCSGKSKKIPNINIQDFVTKID